MGKGVTAVEIDVAKVYWGSMVAMVECVVKDWESFRQYVGIIGVILGTHHEIGPSLVSRRQNTIVQ